MKIRKFISAAICTSMLACFCSGCTGNNTDTEETIMQSTENTTVITTKEVIEKEIPIAFVDDTYHAVKIKVISGNYTIDAIEY